MKKIILLIAIPILIILFYVISLLMRTSAENRAVKRNNLEYESYLSRTIYGTDLVTIINKKINQNEINRISKDEKRYYIENDVNSIKIEVKILLTGKTYQLEEFYNNDMIKFVQNFSLAKFNCTSIEYHEKTGSIRKIIFEEVE